LFGLLSEMLGWEKRIGKNVSDASGSEEECLGFGGAKAPASKSYVALTAAGALRRRTAAEMRVMRRPTGSGSMKV